MDIIVEIPCPRCGGKGRGSWWPDAGVCYRCKGNRIVRVNIPKYEAVLRHLRAKYVSLLNAVRSAQDADEATAASEALSYCVEDGLRVRADLDAARAVA